MSTAAQAVFGGGVAAIVSVAGIWFSRRSAREANRSQQRLTDFQILEGTVATLNHEVERLRDALDDANLELEKANVRARQLNEELDAAQYNVLVLSEHIRRYMPERPFPRDKLRPMNAG